MKRAGYTLIEVMTAVVVMTIGATGIVAMQGASVRANQDANETSNAVNFATTWIERLKRDARRWNQVGAADIANTSWLQFAISNEGAWIVPTTTAPEQAAADINGFDTSNDFVPISGNNDPIAHFCANVRFSVVQAFNPLTKGTDPLIDTGAIRTDVRVWWYRGSSDVNRQALTCRAAPLANAQLTGATSYAFRKTYLSNVVTYKAPGWP